MRSIAYALIFAACLLDYAQAGEFGRLFFTPDQRNQLEFQRASGTSSEEPGSVHSRPYIMVNGVVQKSDGKRTVWINGVAQQTSTNENTPGIVPVTVPGKPQPVPVKVGQKLMLDRSSQDSAP